MKKINEIHSIKVIECFKGNPRYRYSKDIAPDEEDTSGEYFRNEYLFPALTKYEKVHVILTGYNRYDPSFLIEAFAGLIREPHNIYDDNGNKIGESYYTLKELEKRLSFQHDVLKSFEQLIKDEMQLAEEEMVKKRV